MKLFRFDPDVGHNIERFGSRQATLSPLGQVEGKITVACFYLRAGGVIGYHPAAMSQLFMVVQGEGKVRGAEAQWVAIQAGQAAFWQAGEGHETTTERGLTAIVIEGEGLEPGRWMESLPESQ